MLVVRQVIIKINPNVKILLSYWCSFKSGLIFYTGFLRTENITFKLDSTLCVTKYVHIEMVFLLLYKNHYTYYDFFYLHSIDLYLIPFRGKTVLNHPP